MRKELKTTSHIQPPMHEVRKTKDVEGTIANNVTYTTTNARSEEEKNYTTTNARSEEEKG